MIRLDYWMGSLARSAQNFTHTFSLPRLRAENQDSTIEFLRDRFDNIIEEVREFKVEVDAHQLGLAVEELVDIIYISVQTLTQLDDTQVEETIKRIVEKNNNKTLDSHHLCFDGKVRPIEHKDCKCVS